MWRGRYFYLIAKYRNPREDSVTGKIFTVAEHGQNHCRVGNFGLALREMVRWISSLEDTNPEKAVVA